MRLCLAPSPWRLRVLGAVLGALLVGVIAAPAAAAPPEVLLQQISSDPFTNVTSQHATEVEPDSFAYGDTVVTAFQVGRFFDGGASSIGFSTSTDGGKSWRSGILPSLTVYSTPAGSFDRASDPSVAYDAVHDTWLVSSLALAAPCTQQCRSAVLVSGSSDGTAWSAPVAVAALAPSFAHDKSWTVCDNGATSPRRGTCYTSFSDFTNGRRIVTSRSTDGGQTWSAFVGSPDAAATGLGAQPVVRPDGSLVVVFLAGNSENQIGAIRSTDGGVTFGSMTVVSSSTRHKPTSMRGRALPSVETDADGVIYAAWDDCRFRTGCTANDIVIATSSDGIGWTGPVRVPVDDIASGVDYFVPGLAVDAGTSGAAARLALTYHYFPDAACTFASCTVRVGFVSSTTAGAAWEAPVELSPAPTPLAWLPDTTQGRMVGDYISTSFVDGGVAVAVFPLAEAAATGFDQAMFAARVSVAPPPPPPPPPATPEPVTPQVAPPAAPATPVPVEPAPAPPESVSRLEGLAKLVVYSLRAVPARPAAGARFTLRFRVRPGPSGTPLQAGRALCGARIGSSALRLVTGTFARGLVTCTWKIPATAGGRRVRATIGATRGGRTARSAVSYRVRG